MTKHALVKKGSSKTKTEMQTASAEKWRHSGTSSQIAKKTDFRRQGTVCKAKEENDGTFCFIDNLEPDENRCYPDWSRTYAGKNMYKFKHQKQKVVRLMEKHRGAAIHWFQNGHSMKTMITQHDGVLGVDEKTARSFCKE